MLKKRIRNKMLLISQVSQQDGICPNYNVDQFALLLHPGHWIGRPPKAFTELRFGYLPCGWYSHLAAPPIMKYITTEEENALYGAIIAKDGGSASDGYFLVFKWIYFQVNWLINTTNLRRNTKTWMITVITFMVGNSKWQRVLHNKKHEPQLNFLFH